MTNRPQSLRFWTDVYTEEAAIWKQRLIENVWKNRTLIEGQLNVFTGHCRLPFSIAIEKFQ